MRIKEFSECRILIVDDTKSNVDLLVFALKKDYKISVAMDGESALHYAEKTPPDLILLDIVMPGIDGYEVCRRIRSSDMTREIPVMFLSGLEDVQDKARGFEAGGNDFLTKPFELLEIKARVRSLIKSKIYTDAIREEMEGELSAAREIQMGILPSDLHSFTEGTGLDINAIIEPAKQVGGDLYDVLKVGDRIVVTIGDVSGKGIPAAMFMAITVTLARTMARRYEHPDEILSHLNEELAVQNPSCMFVTIVCLVFDLKTGVVTGANAGHNPLVFKGADGETRFVFNATGKIAGVFPDLDVQRESFQMKHGDMIVMYTDGVTEAINTSGDMFDNDRMMECIQEISQDSDAKGACENLMEKVEGFAKGAPQSDDISIIAIKRCRQ